MAREAPARDVFDNTGHDVSDLEKAPVPHFTSKTSVPAPSASFFDMIEATIRGRDGTVAVTSRRAYRHRSAGAMRSDWATMAQPHSSSR